MARTVTARVRAIGGFALTLAVATTTGAPAWAEQAVPAPRTSSQSAASAAPTTSAAPAAPATPAAPAASSASAASASELRRRADEAMDAGRAAEALEMYRRAAAIEPSPALHYNIGRALLATGDFAGALAAFEAFQREAPEALKTRTFRLAEIMHELEAKTSVVEASGSPVGARVLVRGVDVGALPITVRVNAGAADVRVEREGFDTWSERRELRGGGTSRVAVALSHQRAGARLSVTARPSDARVVVDGRGLGAVPVTLDLSAGAHEVVVDAPAFQARRIALDLRRGEDRRVDVALEHEPTPLLKSAWFWAGASVLATAAVLTIVVVTLPRSPDDGTLGTYHVP